MTDLSKQIASAVLAEIQGRPDTPSEDDLALLIGSFLSCEPTSFVEESAPVTQDNDARVATKVSKFLKSIGYEPEGCEEDEICGRNGCQGEMRLVWTPEIYGGRFCKRPDLKCTGCGFTIEGVTPQGARR